MLLWFYFCCTFLNVYNIFISLTSTGMLSWVSITSIALLQFLSPFSSLLLRGNKQWLSGIWSPGSRRGGWQAITGTKQMRQSRTIANGEHAETVTSGLHRGTFSIVKYNHPLFYMHTQEEFLWEFIHMELGKFSNFSDSLVSIWCWHIPLSAPGTLFIGPELLYMFPVAKCTNIKVITFYM